MKTHKDLYISLGSLSELETLLLVAKEVKILSNNTEIFNNIEILRRKLISFLNMLTKNYNTSTHLHIYAFT